MTQLEITGIVAGLSFIILAEVNAAIFKAAMKRLASHVEEARR